MIARVVNFRTGRKTQRTNQFLLTVKDVKSRSEAAAFVGRKVVLKTKSGKLICGKVAAPHGNNGVLRARFTKGVPAEFLGKDIEMAD
jgi:large subunit ribosomal protein L35Ae